MRLGPTTWADLLRVIDWLPDEAALVRWSGPTFTWPLTPEQLRPYLDEAGGDVWMRTLEDDTGTACGLVRVRRIAAEEARYGWVLVDPARRGDGLGRTLVSTSVPAAFTDLGVDRMTLAVFGDNHAARRLYLRAGFTPTGTTVSVRVGEERWEALEHVLVHPDQVISDAGFSDPRLARLYDPLEVDRDDLEVYRSLLRDLGARSVLDVGCGTGSLACLLAADGLRVVGVDPAGASLDLARDKPGADRVRWVLGTIRAALPLHVDAVVMTGNVAQVFTGDDAWADVLAASFESLRPGGRLIFETRDPARRAWAEWTAEHTDTRAVVPGVGPIHTWTDLVDVFDEWVTFRSTVVFEATASTLTSTSTLRFRDQAPLHDDLARAGFVVEQVRDAPDRPGREFVFVARRPT